MVRRGFRRVLQKDVHVGLRGIDCSDRTRFSLRFVGSCTVLL